MFKKVISLFCIACLLVLSFSGCGSEPEFDEETFFDFSKYKSTEKKDGYTYDIYDGYIEIVSYSGSDSVLKIPEEFDKIKVRSIGANAFENNEKIRELLLPEELLRVDDSAFCNCVNLKKVTFPEDMKIIGEKAFYGDNALEEITIPGGVVRIGCLAFSECENLKKVAIPETVKDIGGACFMFTPWLDGKKDEFVTAGDGVLIAYNGNKSDIVIPDGIKTVSAFSNRYGLNSVKFPSSVERIGAMGFAYCNSLKEISLPGSVKEIGDKAFMWCQSLKKITLSDKIEKVGSFAFSDCSVLEKIDFPATLKTLGDRVFVRCAKLTDVTVRSEIVSAGDGILEDTNKDVTISAKVNSPLKDYAEEYGYNFKALG